VADNMAYNALPDNLQDLSHTAVKLRQKLKTHMFQTALGHFAH